MRKTLLVVLFALLGTLSNAQNPYSYFGIGELSGRDHPIFSGLGNTEITLVDSMTLNFFNPASYNSLGAGQPIFSLGFSSRLSTYELGNTSEFNPSSNIHHFAMGLSFAKNFGLGFGLKPFSERNYDFTSGTIVDGDSITYRYTGTGSMNEAFVALSAELLPFWDSTQLSVGANLGWVFGSVANNRYSWLASQSSPTGGAAIETMTIGSLHYDFGMYFKHKFNPNHEVGLYATIDPSQTMAASQSDGIFFSVNVENPNLYDTTFFAEQTGGSFTTSPEFTYGLSYTYFVRDNKVRQYKLHPAIGFHASYSSTDWSQYRNPYDPTESLLSTTKLSFGLQFIPESGDLYAKNNGNMFAKARYRVGYYTFTLPYAVNGEQVSDFGTTFGIGLPVSIGKSLSSINIGASVGRRGTSDASQLQERYYGFNFGISVAPTSAERWFQKRRVY
ncbi:MAG: hypothetical protein DCO96_11500 [Fluviicola sp. XM-24bin1]|nr:MAG: hypothetical protein DCO96_11500 [Fluviicola sp. XM-24bin1]